MTQPLTTGCVWLGDRPADETADCLWRGSGIYETWVERNGAPAAWVFHQDRWALGLQIMNLPLAPLDSLRTRLALPQIPQGLRIRVTGLENGAVEVRWRPLSADEQLPRPWSLITGGRARDPVDPLANCKRLHLGPALGWRAWAHAQGADDVLLRSVDGEWAEAATANVVFGLRDGRVVTPGPGSGALPGTTVAALKSLGLLEFSTIRPDDPRIAWAVLCNAVVGVRTVAQIDGLSLQTPPTTWVAHARAVFSSD